MYKCDSCHYNTNNKYNFNRHYINKHIINKDNSDKFKCHKCYKLLCSKQSLNNHLIICNSITNILQCYKCHKVLSSYSSKSIHLKKCNGLLHLNNTDFTNNKIVININNYNNCNIINFQQNPNIKTKFFIDHITPSIFSSLVNNCNFDYIKLFSDLFKLVYDNKDNRCIKKCSLNSHFSSIKIDNNNWITKPDNFIYPKITKDMANNFLNLFNNKLFEEELYKNIKSNNIISILIDYFNNIENKYELNFNRDDIDSKISKDFNNIVKHIISITFDTSKDFL